MYTILSSLCDLESRYLDSFNERRRNSRESQNLFNPERKITIPIEYNFSKRILKCFARITVVDAWSMTQSKFVSLASREETKREGICGDSLESRETLLY